MNIDLTREQVIELLQTYLLEGNSTICAKLIDAIHLTEEELDGLPIYDFCAIQCKTISHEYILRNWSGNEIVSSIMHLSKDNEYQELLEKALKNQISELKFDFKSQSDKCNQAIENFNKLNRL